ncbi:MAG: translation initiation factor IF-2 [Spirochaetales bacterium]|jgi:translation initiation factor IF-2|nr:translation initiation factor IF-2 [Spirochaetales bacterium]
MSEENGNQKPKATLIKHRKPEPAPAAETEKQERKKVVVVKKKVPLKPEAAPQASPPPPPPPSPPVKPVPPPPAPPAQERSSFRPSYAQDRQPSSYNQDRRPPSSGSPMRKGPREAGGFGGRPQTSGGRPPGPGGRPPGPGGYAPRPSSGGRPGGQRPYAPQDGRGDRPGFFRPGGGAPGPRPGGFKPFAGRPAAPASEEISRNGEKKTGAKKFFKSKKKEAYTKTKKEILREKDFLLTKKKNAQIIANPIPKEINIIDVITVSELARKMNLKAPELITKLMGMGMMVTINQQIDVDTVEIIAAEYGCKVNIVSLYDETLIDRDTRGDDDLKPRAPIVTIMGHVDHGKTKLLDAIRSTDVVAGEFGGITQHISAYRVTIPQGEIVFLDTPGHAAFTLMRERGAKITDIVILVVAANDGVMPQTVEAIRMAKEAKVPILVAINKMDLPDANMDKVKQQLSEYDVLSEEWGGSTLFVPISALKKEGINELLEAVLLQAELLELKANYNCRAEGQVLESRIDQGRGIISTIIIQRGTLRVGDAFVAGVYPGKVKAMFNDRNERIESAGPSCPVEILGIDGVVSPGAPFQVTENEKIARMVGTKRQELEKNSEIKNLKKVTLDNLYDTIRHGEIKELKVIIKGDVHGSVEALKSTLERLSTKDIRLLVIRAQAGAIIEDDVNFANTSGAIIIGFHVRPTAKAQALADQEKVEIRKYNVIYDAVDDIRSAMEGLLAPELQEEIIGTLEVRKTFKVPKVGVIAGSYVTSGKIIRNGNIRVFREGLEIYKGKVSSLKRIKDDAKEVEKGFECGVGIDNFMDIEPGDLFEVYIVKEVAKKLNSGE